MNIVVNFLFPGSQMEVAEVSGPDFKTVPLTSNGGGFRRRSSVFFIDYSHLGDSEKEALIRGLADYNEKQRKIDELQRELVRERKALKAQFCKTQK